MSVIFLSSVNLYDLHFILLIFLAHIRTHTHQGLESAPSECVQVCSAGLGMARCFFSSPARELNVTLIPCTAQRRLYLPFFLALSVTVTSPDSFSPSSPLSSSFQPTRSAATAATAELRSGGVRRSPGPHLALPTYTQTQN